VERSDLYDPKMNRSYAELAVHYRTLIDPARARKPRDKPRIERPMPYIRDSFWRGREFTSVAQMQQAALEWCVNVAGKRCCRPLGGAAPLAVFQAVEAEQLSPLPLRRFVLATWSRATVGPDIHVKVGRCLVFGAVAVHRAEGRRPRHDHRGADLLRRRPDRHPRHEGRGQADRHGTT
jgi:hypothetical protein